jgi:hypothetical protein
MNERGKEMKTTHEGSSESVAQSFHREQEKTTNQNFPQQEAGVNGDSCKTTAEEAARKGGSGNTQLQPSHRSKRHGGRSGKKSGRGNTASQKDERGRSGRKSGRGNTAGQKNESPEAAPLDSQNKSGKTPEESLSQPADGGKTLLPHHLEMLRASAISPEVMKARGYWSATKKVELKELGFSDPQCRVPALVLPVHGVTGDIVLHQIRPDSPRAGANGKSIKYETPKSAKMVLDIPPGARPFLGNPNRPLFVTEGVKKADSAASHGLCGIALLGVWNFRGRNDEGGTTILAAWEYLHLKEREVYIVFDSDVSLKPEVHGALVRLKAFLESRGARVRVIYLEPKPDGSKVGLDDFFAAGGVVATLLAQATDTLHKGPVETHDFPYIETPEGLLWKKPTREGTVDVPLCNFTARIVTECEEDDGVETRRTFDIAVTQGARTATVRSPWDRFTAMNWPIEALGASAAIIPGPGARDHVRFATQLFSIGAPQRKLYTHLGWRKVGDAWVYLHADGAIGAAGTGLDIEVVPPAALERYCLPSRPQGDERVQAVRASLRTLGVARRPVSAPPYCAIWRAVFGDNDFSVHITGLTGEGKQNLLPWLFSITARAWMLVISRRRGRPPGTVLKVWPLPRKMHSS